MSKIELLSPAGSLKSLKYAIQSGADAVYLGLKNYSARKSAKNFDIGDLQEGLYYAHLRGKKVYLAINTLLNQGELKDALSLVKDLKKLRPDALIIQDLGFASLLKDLTKIPLHASTQMTAYNIQGVKKLKELGFKRTILARELSISEIEEITRENIMEIEVFCHGALCISYSGQCLLSSGLGYRSGNKGDCAQPCRLKYGLLTEKAKEEDFAYRISPNDLALLPYLDKLLASGIKSIKIEGRLKSPEYTALVTSKYRKALDALRNNESFYNEKDIDDLTLAFSRGKFTSYHLLKKMPLSDISYTSSGRIGLEVGKLESINKYKGGKGPDIFDLEIIGSKTINKGDGIRISTSEDGGSVNSISKDNGNHITLNIAGRLKENHNKGDLIYKTYDKEIDLSIEKMMKEENVKIPLNFSIELAHGKPAKLIAKDGDKLIQIFSKNTVDMAKNMPLTEDDIKRQLSKLGSSIYSLAKLDIYLEENSFLPMSDLASLRRQALDKISKRRIEK